MHQTFCKCRKKRDAGVILINTLYLNAVVEKYIPSPRTPASKSSFYTQQLVNMTQGSVSQMLYLRSTFYLMLKKTGNFY